MDAHDESILTILEQNAFEDRARIAKRLAIPLDEVNQRIAALERDRLILGYKAIVNREKAASDKVFAVIEVHATPQRDEGFDKLARRIALFPEVKSLYLFSGGYDFLLHVEGENLKAIANFIAVKLSTVDGITGTGSHFMLRTYKEDGVLLDDAPKSDRLTVSP